MVYGYQSKVISTLAFYLSIKWFLLLMGIYNLGLASFLLDIDRINCKFLKTLVLSITCWLIFSFFLPKVFLRFPVHDFTAKCVFLLLCFTCNQNIGNEKKRLFYILWLIILLVSSGASKGYAIAAFALGVYVYVCLFNKKISMIALGVIGLLTVIAAWKDIHFYYIEGVEREYARALMLMTSIAIANDYFPLGTGFGTFGSYYSKVNYSPVYYLYHLENHREIGKKTRLFIMDAYLPIIIGETGWIGAIAIGTIMFLLLLITFKTYQYSTKLFCAMLICMVYLAISFVEETGFQQPALMILAVFMGAALSEKGKPETGLEIE